LDHQTKDKQKAKIRPIIQQWAASAPPQSPQSGNVAPVVPHRKLARTAPSLARTLKTKPWRLAVFVATTATHILEPSNATPDGLFGRLMKLFGVAAYHLRMAMSARFLVCAQAPLVRSIAVRKPKQICNVIFRLITPPPKADGGTAYP